MLQLQCILTWSNKTKTSCYPIKYSALHSYPATTVRNHNPIDGHVPAWPVISCGASIVPGVWENPAARAAEMAEPCTGNCLSPCAWCVHLWATSHCNVQFVTHTVVVHSSIRTYLCRCRGLLRHLTEFRPSDGIVVSRDHRPRRDPLGLFVPKHFHLWRKDLIISDISIYIISSSVTGEKKKG